MRDFDQQLEEIMHQRNFYIRGTINYRLTGKFQRFQNASKSKRSKDLFVILHDYDRGASFGDWHHPNDWYTYWNENYDPPSIVEWRKIKQEEAEMKLIKAYERQKHEWRAKELWNKYYLKDEDPTNHPYIINKKIIPYYAKKYRSKLYVPISNVNFELMTLQIIKPNGFKRLWKGTTYKKYCIWLCDELEKNYKGVIYLCEGYATGCTLKEITQSPVLCGINSLNLIRAAIEIRRKFIWAKVKICADNDKYGEENIGLKHAFLAAKYTGYSVYYPIFDSIHEKSKPTDFNDLYQLLGIEEVIKQLQLAR